MMNTNGNGNGQRCGRDKTSDQLHDWKVANEKETLRARNAHGAPQPTLTKSLTVGPRGPILLQDTNFIEHLANFDRERLPERVVHAKGAGAFGFFEVTHDIRQYCRAKVFDRIGKKTPVAVRFSTVGGESGSADTVRDPRGFAIKFYTDDGNWDLVGNNTPIFFLRDPILFPSFIHTQKRNPATHLKDVDMFWDFITLRPETTHQVCFLFSDRGIPDGYRHMNGYGSHAFKIVNSDGKRVYCKFHLKTDQGIKNIPVDKAHRICADDPDYALHDLCNAIAEDKFPSWSMYIQLMTFEQAEKFKWNPFDVTKVWPHSLHPLIPVGKLVLNRNPVNYFAEVEQLAFSPANMVRGIEPSPDKMLQGRLFSYPDTQRYRLGPNYAQLPVNCPFQAIQATNYGRGLAHDRQVTAAPNYFPNSFNGPAECPMGDSMSFNVSGDVQRYDSSEDDNFTQADHFWTKVLTGDERKRMVENIACHLKNVQPFIQERAVKNFTSVNPEFGRMVREGLHKNGKNGHYYSQFQTVHQLNGYSRSSNL